MPGRFFYIIMPRSRSTTARGALQSILFDRRQWTPSTAERWLVSHNFMPIKDVDITRQLLRYRLRDPIEFSDYRKIKFGKGISAVYGILEIY